MTPFNREGTDLTFCLFLIVLVLTCAIGVGLPSISADNYGIMLDNTCKTMIKNNISSDCPTYEDIITLFPDTSNRKISGEFGYYNGFYQRLPTKFIDSFEYYHYGDNNILFIDPPAETAQRIKLIEIKANLKEYKLPNNKSYDAKNHTLTLGVGRYISACQHAYIDSTNWTYLLGDTIFHMQHGCSEDSTTYVSKTTTQLNKTKHDISTSYKYKLAQWQKESLLKCGTKICIYEGNQTGPP